MTSDGSSSFRVPPYAITRGRTRVKVDLAIEAMVTTTDAGSELSESHERARILQLCSEPLSVAEVSAHLSLPLQVTKILVGDLLEENYLSTGSSSSNNSDSDGKPDLQLLERVLGGLQSL